MFKITGTALAALLAAAMPAWAQGPVATPDPASPSGQRLPVPLPGSDVPKADVQRTGNPLPDVDLAVEKNPRNRPRNTPADSDARTADAKDLGAPGDASRRAGEVRPITPSSDTSGNKSFFESRSNTARTPGEAKPVAPAADPSGNKSFFESRSNTARTPGEAARDPKASQNVQPATAQPVAPEQTKPKLD